ncbi:MAG: alpha/beta hydrolase domain-containing protein [Bryobacteraceae bacterium]
MRNAALLSLLACAGAFSAVTTVHVVDRTDVMNGKSFGAAGPYEQITARAYFAVDPQAEANRLVADIQHAARNAQGLVEFSADVYVLKPRDPAKGNGTAFFEVSNRGGRSLVRTFNLGGDAREYGDGYLFEQGYTLVWLGWQFDVAKRPGLLRVEVPVAKGVSGLVREDFQCTEPTSSFRLQSDYPLADQNEPGAKLYVRDTTFGKRTLMAREQWRFSDAFTVTMKSPCQPGKSYDVVYTSKDPAVAGLGGAGIRDFISFLKYGGGDAVALLGDQSRFLKRAIAFGSSQSGRYLRQFVHDGFNADEKGRIVFDAVWPHVAGASMGSFNHRFAQPSPTQPYYPLEVFPFRDLPDRDPVTGLSGGLLDRATKSNTVPKIINTFSSNEYYGRSASLTHTTIDGGADAPLAPGTRIYHISGTQHGSGQLPPRRSEMAMYETGVNDYRPVLRAVLSAVQAWLTTGKEPPPSAYSRIQQLAALDQMKFPAIPGFVHPRQVRQAMRLDYGPEFRSAGIIANEPAETVGAPYSSKLPQLDADGNELGGIRMPMVAVPLATHLAWNMVNPKHYTNGEMMGLNGSHIAFPRTKAERMKLHDPRLSIEERYKSREEYLAKVKSTADALVSQGYLLARDVPMVVAQCGRHWDLVFRPEI